jgi:hypothetical protein
MEEWLDKTSLRHFRVPAYTVNDLYIPKDITKVWQTPQCLIQTSEAPPNDSASSSPWKLFVRGLCGTKQNELKELAPLVSHLLAIEKAVHSPTATSRFALILEDDVSTPFDIDFGMLIKTITSRGSGKDFAVLQLMNSKLNSAKELSDRYKRSGARQFLWHPRTAAVDGRYLSSW